MRPVVLAVLALLVLPAVAHGQTPARDIAAVWDSNRWVYHAGAVDTDGPIDDDALEQVIAASGQRIHMAIVETSAAEGKTADAFIAELQERAFGDATYVLVLDREYRAISDYDVPAQRLLDEALADRPGDTQGALELFVARVAATAPPVEGPGFWWVWLFVGPLLLLFAGATAYAIRLTVRNRRLRRV